MTEPITDARLAQLRSLAKRWAEIAEEGDAGTEPVPSMLRVINELLDHHQALAVAQAEERERIAKMCRDAADGSHPSAAHILKCVAAIVCGNPADVFALSSPAEQTKREPTWVDPDDHEERP